MFNFILCLYYVAEVNSNNQKLKSITLEMNCVKLLVSTKNPSIKLSFYVKRICIRVIVISNQ